MDKLKMQSENLVSENIDKIAMLFPNCVTEGKNEQGEIVRVVDFDLLKQELSKDIVEGTDERYTLNWAGKKQSILTANSPIAKTLRPCREESVNFDSTQNLYIEGDNLDVLKLLRETYLNKVKMIYIDPPYNTGNDFVYEDDFADSTDSYLEKSKSFDEQGNRLFQNNDSNGRFHSDWLSMMFSRLRLAKDLLTDDGVIFISIDDNEQANLKKICDEIFGADNFISNLVWQKKTGASDAVTIATITENILIYSKNINNVIFAKNIESYDLARYKYNDEFVESRGVYYIDNLDRGGLQYSDSLNYGIECPDGTIAFPNGRKEYKNEGWIWKWSKDKIKWARENKFIEFRKSNNKESGWSVCYKNYLNVDNENKPIERSAPHKNLITNILNANAAALMKELFGTNSYFNYSKPIELIKFLVSMVKVTFADIILDFFSGSATTAHAVMQLNAEDGGERKFIMVQLPEKTDEGSEAYKAGYKNICEIGKERIRRAGNKIKAENQMTAPNLDVGFRVLKLDTTCMKDVYYAPSDIDQGFLSSLESNIKEDRSPEDLLFQVMLDMGVILSSEIKVLDINGKKVFNVNDNNLICCFDPNLTDEVVTQIAKLKPLYSVFRDSSMSSDSTAVNFDQIFSTYSPATTRRVI